MISSIKTASHVGAALGITIRASAQVLEYALYLDSFSEMRLLTNVGQTVFVFLVTVTSTFHYIVQRLNYARDIARVKFIIREAKAAAWGQKMSPIEGRRKVRSQPFYSIRFRLGSLNVAFCCAGRIR